MTDQPPPPVGVADDRVALRAFLAGDLPFLDRLVTDPAALGPFEWPGFADARSRRRRWELDGYLGAEFSALAAVLPDGIVAGLVSWRPRDRGGPPGVCLAGQRHVLPAPARVRHPARYLSRVTRG